MSSQADYAELHCITHFTFLRGASSPEELINRAAELGYTALAITDECSLAGVVRAHVAAREHAIRLLIGSEFVLEDGLKLVVLAGSRQGYAQLCELITRGRRAASKGEYHLTREDCVGSLHGCLILCPPGRSFSHEDACWLQESFPGHAWLAAELPGEGDDSVRIERCRELAGNGLPVVATGNVHMHLHRRRALQDTLTAIRIGIPVQHAGEHLYANGERYLRDRAVIVKRFPIAWRSRQ